MRQALALALAGIGALATACKGEERPGAAHMGDALHIALVAWLDRDTGPGPADREMGPAPVVAHVYARLEGQSASAMSPRLIGRSFGPGRSVDLHETASFNDCPCHRVEGVDHRCITISGGFVTRVFGPDLVPIPGPLPNMVHVAIWDLTNSFRVAATLAIFAVSWTTGGWELLPSPEPEE